jgi:hypothetical protein
MATINTQAARKDALGDRDIWGSGVFAATA